MTVTLELYRLHPQTQFSPDLAAATDVAAAATLSIPELSRRSHEGFADDPSTS
jgi:hypothetical protein